MGHSGTRKVVPAALHSELSEYASLLRALRTSDTLDIVSQLTRTASSTASVMTDTDEDEDQENEAERTVDRTGTTEYNTTGSVGQKDAIELMASTKLHENTNEHTVGSAKSDAPTLLSAPSGRKRKREKKLTNDTWTRWPLMADDVPIPEWSLEDEVHVIASRELTSLKRNRHSPSQTTEAEASGSSELLEEDAGEGDIESEDDELSEPIPGVAFAASEHLGHILGALAAHMPPAEGSMQNRLCPVGWESVLSSVAASGLATPE
jgi:hypothetical protein